MVRFGTRCSEHFNYLLGMKTPRQLWMALCLLLPMVAVGQVPQMNVIPLPESWSFDGGFIEIEGELTFEPENLDLSQEQKIIESWWDESRTSAEGQEVAVTMLIHANKLPHERYVLRVNESGIMLIAGSRAGLFYGIQTLMQLKQHGSKLPKMTVGDQPRFRYRGMHLDVCRHFYDVDFIKKYLDAMAMHKMNRFHWHLTEDQGWRIEIKKYPKLTEVGAWRDGSQIGPYSNQEFDTIRYGGFYTQDEIREVVDYAASLHIEVIPEIELPGHAMAALAAYPEYSCRQESIEVAQGWGVFDDVYCAGNDSTFAFLEDVLTEVMALFPSEYIHIGGDECPKTRWKECAKCQQRMADEHLHDEHELQSYFIQRIETFLNDNGRQLIGWDEILEGGLAPNATVMSWRGEAGGIAAAQSGHDAIMTPGQPCYWDHYQSKDSPEPHAIGGYNPVENVYLYNPVPEALRGTDAERYIIGAQANVWTEYILTEEHVEYMVFPRQFALAEVLWTGTREEEDLEAFRERARIHAERLRAMGYHVAPHFFEPKEVEE